MKAIILAAGIGSRLKPLTNNIPKSLLKLRDDERIMDRTIRMLNEKGITDITIVVGYEHEQFTEFKGKCNVIFNPFFRETNSIVSLWFAREKMNDEVIVLNADVIFTEELLMEIINCKNEATVFIDTSVKKEADYKVDVDLDRVIVMSKELTNFYGEYIGITKLGIAGSVQLKDKIERMIAKGALNEWYENALVEMIYNEEFRLDYLDVSDYIWIEIDNINDLALAKKMSKKK